MKHEEILNYLILNYNYKSYLEIGTFNGDNYESINIENKECCDITDELYQNITYLMTSDEMFHIMPAGKKYDIIFIDGMHTEEYVDRDIINSLKHLNKGGVVCVHDVLPISPKSSIDYTDLEYNRDWVGTSYKSICKLNNENLEYYTVDNGDFGLTIIKYCDNPYRLNFDQYKCNQTYDNLFLNKNNDIKLLKDNYSDQGKFALHIINEKEFFNIFI